MGYSAKLTLIILPFNLTNLILVSLKHLFYKRKDHKA